MRRLFLSTGLLLLFISRQAWGQAGYDFHGDKTEMRQERETGRIVGTATGHARLESEGMLLVADEMLAYFEKNGSNTYVARGNVCLTQGPQRVLAEEITFHTPDQTFTAKSVRMGEWPFFLSSTTMTGTLRHVIAHDAHVSYHEPGPFVPAFTASRLIYDRPEKRVHADNAHIGIGKTVPLHFPNFDQKIDEPALSYLTANAGYRSSLGAFLGVGALIPIQPGIQVGGNVNYYTRRGIMAGPAAAYGYKSGENVTQGELRSGYIRDHGTRLTDVLNKPIAPDRAFLDWRHYQEVTSDVTVFGQVNYWRDSEVLRDFQGQRYYHVQVPDSFLEADYDRNNYVVSVLTRAQPNRYHLMQERLPEVRFDLLPTNVGGGLQERFNASVVRLKEDQPVAGDSTLRSDRADAYYGLERPWSPREWLTLIPVAGGRVTYYDRALGGRNNYTRTIGEIGLDGQLLASGVYDYKNPQWKIDGIRHLVTPKFSYRYMPSAEKGRAYIPPIDDLAFSTYLQPLGLGDQRNIDDLHETNTLRLGLDNLFQTRDKTYGSRDLLRFNIAADLLMDHPAGEHTVSDLHTELEFMPATWVRFEVYQRTSPSTFGLHELNTGFTILDGQAWSARLYNHYLKHQIAEYISEGRYRLNEAYAVQARLHYDSRRNRFVEKSIGLQQNLDNLWSIRYGLSFYSGRSRESNFGFNIEVRLAGF